MVTDDNCAYVTELFRKDDIIWSLMKASSHELSSVVPTWAAYNSLITERKDNSKWQSDLLRKYLSSNERFR